MNEMGMVWMGAGQSASDMSMGLMATENSELMLEQENPYFTPSHNSASNHSLDDIHGVQDSSMAMDNVDILPYGEMKRENSDGSYMDDDNSHTVYMVTTATQTILPCSTRKIKPVKHPGLVLKTPIAYQSNTDPSVIPIQKDGIAVCEKCGAIGVKHAFYTRERRFCSMACARGYSGLIPEPLPQTNQTTPDTKHYAEHRFKMELEEDLTGFVADQQLPQLPPPPAAPPIDDNVLLSRRKPSELVNSYDWEPHLDDVNFFAAPVTCFKHAPISDIWSNILVGMKVEVENTDCDNVSEAFPDSFWVATVMKIIGYKALLRYEGFGMNESKDFWVSLCSNQVHPVGWCATRGKPLIPPKTIENKYSDWKEFLCKRLTGARTLPSNFSNKINDSMKSRFHRGLNLEVVDKNRISQVKVAMVHKIIGKRLNVKYYDLPPEDAGFWCHEDSPLLHPVGWAKKVGHHLVAPVDYLERVNEGIFDEDDATEDLFNPVQIGSRDSSLTAGFCIGMKLEAIDPLNLSSICVATVMDVLRCGYIMIRIDTYESDATGADWFCYHVSSPCIFPIGFCQRHSIPLTPPKGYDSATFNWKRYLLDTSNVPVNPCMFAPLKTNHGFVEGMKMEAADLMDPRLVCVATVAKVAGRLLKVHFDGWEDEYDQWLDCESSDIYPVGWCHSVGHKLEGPKVVPKQPNAVIRSPKGLKKRGRKKKGKDSPPKNQQTNKLTKSEPPPAATMKNEVLEEEIDDDNIQEPETGQEPSGPDQSMPVPSELQPPPERKATSYINTTGSTSPKVIPRLIDSSGTPNETNGLCPEEWNVFDVAQFLRVNDCANYCDNFSKQKIDGKMLLNLNKEDIIEFTGGKVGPSLKIYDLIQQLKIKVNPAQLRHMKANVKKFL
ncbi:polycomb protein Sfmbt isoform X2 [Agrilus planipennis]|uniref:Polycomb protein Sfmbt isoform X2 n=1 Tax=Agrilus planipennis TaxID=224129 RepID=A0A7F5R5D6_AGRPL|nr:polycomb protein Sfmbt isoform X2 [Agrilus planipennis]